MINIVKSCPLFQELYHDELEDILQECVVVHFEPGANIIKEGEEGKDFFVVLSGRATVSKNIKGREVKIATLTKGDVFGERVILNDNIRATTISAMTGCDFLVVDHETILNLYQKNPKTFSILVMNMVRLLDKRLSHSKAALRAIHERLNRTNWLKVS
ncbi:MAG: cyclic nucleotide-binding domain-containing protein [Halobacteriovoraceae bacterium]|nr:cyclic nucleotide-binding domain-containing protein [Halobacteriovoraceae bacterium]MBT5094259.1 cyclic nucleotide-binding domain-containing protein [Halobacteriovoraceae bacterium]